MKKLALWEVALIFSLVEIRIWGLDKMGWVTVAATALPILIVLLSWYRNEYLEAKSFYLLHARLSGNEISLKEIQKLSQETALSQLGILPTDWKKDLE